MVISDKGVLFVHLNVRSIFRKLRQIEVLYNKFDFIFCTETWLDNRYSDAMVNIENMKILGLIENLIY